MEPRNRRFKHFCKMGTFIVMLLIMVATSVVIFAINQKENDDSEANIGDADNNMHRKEPLLLQLWSSTADMNVTAFPYNESSDSSGSFFMVVSPHKSSDMPIDQVYSIYVKNINLSMSDLNASIFNNCSHFLNTTKPGFETGYRDFAKFNFSMVNFIMAIQILLILLYFKLSKKRNPHIQNVKITYLTLNGEVVEITINSRSQNIKIFKRFRNAALVGFFLIFGYIACDIICTLMQENNLDVGDDLFSFNGLNFYTPAKHSYDDLADVKNWVLSLFPILDVILIFITLLAYKIVINKLNSTVDILNVVNSTRILSMYLMFGKINRELLKSLSDIMLLGILLKNLIYITPYDFYDQVALKFLLETLLVFLEIILILTAFQLYKNETDKIKTINGVIVSINIVEGNERVVERQLNLMSRLKKIAKAFFTIMFFVEVSLLAIVSFIYIAYFIMNDENTGSNVGVTVTTGIKQEPAFPTFLLTPTCNKNITVGRFFHEFDKLSNDTFDYDELKFNNCSAILLAFKQTPSFENCDQYILKGLVFIHLIFLGQFLTFLNIKFVIDKIKMMKLRNITDKIEQIRKINILHKKMLNAYCKILIVGIFLYILTYSFISFATLAIKYKQPDDNIGVSETTLPGQKSTISPFGSITTAPDKNSTISIFFVDTSSTSAGPDRNFTVKCNLFKEHDFRKFPDKFSAENFNLSHILVKVSNSSKRPDKFPDKNFMVYFILTKETNSSLGKDKLADKNFTVYYILVNESDFFKGPGNFSVLFLQETSNKTIFAVFSKIFYNITIIRFYSDEYIFNNYTDSLMISESCDTEILLCFLMGLLEGFAVFFFVFMMGKIKSNPSRIIVLVLDIIYIDFTEI